MKLIKKTKDSKGFTLIELVVVIAILAILALVLIPTISGQVEKATASKNQANIRSIYSAAMLLDAEEPAKDGTKVADEWVTKLKQIYGLEVGDELEIFKASGRFSINYEGITYP